ncbi:uncharacterized protein N7525_008994 [Penicillium rubens]|uniref:uncharacterized protein n=1 Tax=Penicillium rubens TaxID=1108849 RepID=UPI002A5A8A82|nr:uncharacterized protein N7525_008994 [Penicillium rubens]KAJ5830741.1 hypothetical protein N7525_008994 [Penicillium rubens]KAJ5854323.1 hypothetical protein N7534_006866 [Penicillium rubens]
MDGLEVVPEQHKAGKYDSGLEVAPEQYKYDSGLEVVPHTEKEVQRDTAGLHYVSGPTGANPGIIEDGSAETKPPRKRICGLSSTVFWVLIVIVAIVVTGAAVGGGVGSTVSKKTTPSDNSAEPSNPPTSTSPSTDTASTTSSGHVTSGTVGLAGNPCPRSNRTTERGSDGSTYRLLCGVDWPRGADAASGGGKVRDLSTETEYTLKACIRRCSDWNKDDLNSQDCKGVVYSANLTASFEGGQGGNCFLKSEIGNYFPNSNTSVAAGIGLRDKDL